MQIEWKWCGGFNRDNLKDKLYITRNLWEKAPFPSLIVYLVPLHGDYIQMSLFPWTRKWEPQTETFCCLKTLVIRIFFKSNLL